LTALLNLVKTGYEMSEQAFITFQCSGEMANRIEAVCEANRRNRSNQIRVWIEKALATEERKIDRAKVKAVAA